MCRMTRNRKFLGAIAFILIVMTLIVTPLFLKEEISLEPSRLEMNVIPGVDLKYNLTIKNIGSEKLNLGYSSIGINQTWMNFSDEGRIYRGRGETLSITIKILNAPPGDYKGYIAIWNKINGNVLERIPFVLNVKEANQTPKDQNHLATCNSTPPTIIQEPEDQIISKDKKWAIFAVEAEGTQPLHYQWRKNKTENISGAIRNYYSYVYPGIVITNKGPAGNYSVLVWNKIDNKICLTESRPATLRNM